MTKLVIATPVRSGDYRTGQVSVGYMDFVHTMRTKGAEYYGGAITYGCDVVRGRNRIVGKVLRDCQDATHVLWVDDDNWPEDARVVDDMIALGEDVVGVPYTNKRPPLRWVFQPFENQLAPDSRGMARVRGLGFGFTMTSVRALRSLSNNVDWYTDQNGIDQVPDLFSMLYDTHDSKRYLLSEDYSFCKRWRDGYGHCALFTRGVVYHSGAYAWSARDMANGVIS